MTEQEINLLTYSITTQVKYLPFFKGCNYSSGFPDKLMEKLLDSTSTDSVLKLNLNNADIGQDYILRNDPNINIVAVFDESYRWHFNPQFVDFESVSTLANCETDLMIVEQLTYDFSDLLNYLGLAGVIGATRVMDEVYYSQYTDMGEHLTSYLRRGHRTREFNTKTKAAATWYDLGELYLSDKSDSVPSHMLEFSTVDMEIELVLYTELMLYTETMPHPTLAENRAKLNQEISALLPIFTV